MGRSEGSGFPGTLLLRPFSLERLLFLVLVIITVGFGISYTRLLYERHQVTVRNSEIERRVQYERLRYKDLKHLLQWVQEDWYRAQEAARLWRSAIPGTEIWVKEGEARPGGTSAAGGDNGTDTSPEVPVWRQWMQVFHLDR